MVIHSTFIPTKQDTIEWPHKPSFITLAMRLAPCSGVSMLVFDHPCNYPIFLAWWHLLYDYFFSLSIDWSQSLTNHHATQLGCRSLPAECRSTTEQPSNNIQWPPMIKANHDKYVTACFLITPSFLNHPPKTSHQLHQSQIDSQDTQVAPQQH